MSTKTSPLQLLLNYIRPQRWMAVSLAVLVLGGIALQLINPQVMRSFLDGVQNNRPLDALYTIAALFIILALIRQGFQVASTYVGEQVAWTATNALRADLALHCLKLDMSFHKVYKPGELIERVDGDVNQLALFFSQLVIRLTANFLLCLGVLVLLWTIDWRIGLVLTLIIAAGMVAVRYLNNLTIPRVQELRQIESTLFGYVEEWLNGTETIRSNAAEPYIMNRLYALLRERWHRGHESMKLNVLMNNVPHTVFALAYIAVFTIGIWRFTDGLISVGTIYITLYYIDMLRSPLWEFTRQVEELQRAMASINRVNELFAIQPTIRDGQLASLNGHSSTTLPTTQHGLMVEFDHVHFAYDDEPDNPVLQDIDFTLTPGTVLGLLGRTGSGKTTLTKLLIRFYDPTAGAISLGDGTTQLDLRALAQTDLRQQIGVVTQQVQLFHATVRENLTLFDPTISDERILRAIAEVGLTAWLANLPAGLDSHLAADTGLSAGEAQLLAFTRVFLNNPQLIILDEASSRLDPATEQLIEKALDKLLHNRTVVIVAHRLATVQRAHEIMILGHGRIIEHGRREALVVNPHSHFYELLQTGLEEAFA